MSLRKKFVKRGFLRCRRCRREIVFEMKKASVMLALWGLLAGELVLTRDPEQKTTWFRWSQGVAGGP